MFIIIRQKQQMKVDSLFITLNAGKSIKNADKGCFVSFIRCTMSNFEIFTTRHISLDQKIPDSFVGGSFVFLVDSSIDVSPFNFERAKEFIKGLTDAFNSPSSNVHSALINYGDRVHLVYNLDNEMNTTALHRAIDSAEAVGGGRRIERALEAALRLIRNSEQPAPNVMLLITAGPFIQVEKLILLLLLSLLL